MKNLRNKSVCNIDDLLHNKSISFIVSVFQNCFPISKRKKISLTFFIYLDH